MFEKKLDFELVKQIRKGHKEKAVVFCRDKRAFWQFERRFQIVKKFPFISAIGIECDFQDAKLLSEMNCVEYVTRQTRVTACLDEHDEYGSKGIEALRRLGSPPNLLDFSKNLNGEGTTLCTLDTGVSPHLDLCMPKNRVKEFVDLIDDKKSPYDDNGHGTFVAGVALGNGVVSGKNIVGIAPMADLVAVKVISHTGESGAFKVLEGMQWVIDHARKFNIKTVCMSFGSEPLSYSDPLKLGAEILVKNGITVVCASGNSGRNSLKSPGISPYVITVGAVDKDNFEATFSSSGEFCGVRKPDVYALGVHVKGLSTHSAYMEMSGTSVSAPYVAGAVCLLNQKYPNLSPYDAKWIILNSAFKKDKLKILNLS